MELMTTQNVFEYLCGWRVDCSSASITRGENLQSLREEFLDSCDEMQSGILVWELFFFPLSQRGQLLRYRASIVTPGPNPSKKP
jgi:hypothetical protein